MFAGKEVSKNTHAVCSPMDGRAIEIGNGLFVQAIQLSGLAFESTDSNELNYRPELREAMQRVIGNSRFGFYRHVIRLHTDHKTDVVL